MSETYDKVSVVIPAYNPDNRIYEFTADLLQLGFDTIVVVNDGSDDKTSLNILEELRRRGVVVIGYKHNKGKGFALKEGFAYVLDNMPDAVGVVSADYDGRQSASALSLVADKLLEGCELVLGERDIDGSKLSKGVRRGYKLTQWIFRVLYSNESYDIQTGLRGIATVRLGEFLDIKGNRYEYEPKMLVEAIRQEVPITRVDAGVIEPIGDSESTIYLSDNFRPFLDSLLISVALFLNFLEYTLTSLTATALDFVVFYILSDYVFDELDLGLCVFLSTLLARILSATLSFVINRKVVFKSDANLAKTIVMYYTLAVIIMLCSAELVTLFVFWFGGNKTFTKLLVDLCLFFLSYQIQQRVIFRKK